ncbi:MAG: hypothetical protein HRU15_19495 [Planctomycetes bacterium]|nr:hypothetical protein [Planctomycetota bacterium]
MKRLLLSCFFLSFFASCEYYDWAPGQNSPAAAPAVYAGDDMVLTSNISSPVTLNTSVSDPDTSNSSLTMSWSGGISDPAPVAFDTSAAQHTALFSRNGTYQLTLSVDDGTTVVQDSVVIVVSGLSEFRIAGTVTDNLALSQGVQVDLQYSDGTLIETLNTDASGTYSFNALIGSVDNYEVIVN